MSRSLKAIGVDIGGTKMAVAAVDTRGSILARATLPTAAELGFAGAVERLAEAIERLLSQVGWARGELSGVGLGCAGPVNPSAGLINNPYTLSGWNQCDVVSPLRERFGVPVWLENDADVAALGECYCGAGRGFDPVVMLTFGTGVGGAAIVRGEIYRGAGGEHPELGHVSVDPRGPQCYCGIRGCLESLASGTAVGEVGQAADLPDSRAVFAAAVSGSETAQRIVERATAAAATAAWIFCHTFLPQRLVLGGGMMDAHFDLFAGVIAQRLSAATQFSHPNVSVVRAALGNDAGLVGAASLAFRRATEFALDPLSSV